MLLKIFADLESQATPNDLVTSYLLFLHTTRRNENTTGHNMLWQNLLLDTVSAWNHHAQDNVPDAVLIEADHVRL